MSERRFFLRGAKMGVNLLEGEENNHLVNVMRCAVGDKVILVGDDEFDYHGIIVEIKKNHSIINVDEKIVNRANPRVDVTAFIAMNKREHMNLIVRMLSELGVMRIVPIITKWTLRQDQTEKIERYQKIAEQSTKQCRRSISLKIEKPIKLDEACKSFDQFDRVFFANESETENALQFATCPHKVAFVIGPVAGFDMDEVQLIKNCGASSITLGKRILRADTATIALASAIMQNVGEWN